MDYGWRPKGFERFLSDFGIVAEEVGAREGSVAKAVVQPEERTASAMPAPQPTRQDES